MTTRAAATLAICLALVAGFLTWRVVGSRDQRCLWAVTVGTRDMGYEEVPCDSSSVKHVLEQTPTTSPR